MPTPAATAPTTELGVAGVSTIRTPELGHFLDAPVDDVIELTWPFFVRTVDRISRDSKVAASERGMFLPILGADWRVNPRRARPEVVERVADNLDLPILGDDDRQPARTRDRFDWPFFLRHQLLSRRYGFMPFEQVYRLANDGLYDVRKLAVRMPATISDIRVGRDGGLEAVVQRADLTDSRATALNGIVIPQDRMVMYVHDREGYGWRGRSILRPIYREWLLKDHAHRVGAIAAERNGVGVPVYTDPPPGDGVDVAKEAAAGQKLAQTYRAGSGAGGRIPHGATLELLAVAGSVFPLLEWIRYYDAEIAGSVLDNFSSLPSAPNGSRALGTSLIDFFTRSLNAHSKDLAVVTTNHVVEDYVEINWGPAEPSPAVECGEIGADQQLTATAIKQLIDSGAIAPDSALEGYLRRYWHLPATAATPAAAPPAAQVPPPPPPTEAADAA